MTNNDHEFIQPRQQYDEAQTIEFEAVRLNPAPASPDMLEHSHARGKALGYMAAGVVAIGAPAAYAAPAAAYVPSGAKTEHIGHGQATHNQFDVRIPFHADDTFWEDATVAHEIDPHFVVKLAIKTMEHDNDAPNPRRVEIGSILVPRKVAEALRSFDNPKIYTVKPGDTLTSISEKFGTSLAATEKDNPNISNPNLIYPGQEVNVPGGENTSSGIIEYVVQSGDSLWAIARDNDTTVRSLVKLNHIANPNFILTGQTLEISQPRHDAGVPQDASTPDISLSPAHEAKRQIDDAIQRVISKKTPARTKWGTGRSAHKETAADILRNLLEEAKKTKVPAIDDLGNDPFDISAQMAAYNHRDKKHQHKHRASAVKPEHHSESNNEVAFNFFKREWKLNNVGAAGVEGNLNFESGVNPNQKQIGGGDGKGIAQFSGTTREEMEQWCKSHHLNPNSLMAQLKFIAATAGEQVIDNVRSAKTVAEATAAFQGTAKVGGHFYGYERPQDESGSLARRTALAQDIYNDNKSALAPKAPSAPASTAPAQPAAPTSPPTPVTPPLPTQEIQPTQPAPTPTPESPAQTTPTTTPSPETPAPAPTPPSETPTTPVTPTTPTATTSTQSPDTATPPTVQPGPKDGVENLIQNIASAGNIAADNTPSTNQTNPPSGN